MRLPRFRFTIRRAAALIAAVAVGLWLGGTAWRVARAPSDGIWHLWFDRSTSKLTVDGHEVADGFWPRYGRALLGRSWPGGYVCACRARPHPGRVELAASGDQTAVWLEHGRLSEPSRLANEHRAAAESLAATIAYDENRLAEHWRMLMDYARKGTEVHGGEGVARAFAEGIAHNRRSLRHHERLRGKYEEAMRHPWLPVEPDPPAPDPNDPRPD